MSRPLRPDQERICTSTHVQSTCLHDLTGHAGAMLHLCALKGHQTLPAGRTPGDLYARRPRESTS